MGRRNRTLRRPRTTVERRAASAADADRDESEPGLRTRERPTAWDDQVIAALYDRTRNLPPFLSHLRDRKR